jgi:hypothetical protein
VESARVRFTVVVVQQILLVERFDDTCGYYVSTPRCGTINIELLFLLIITVLTLVVDGTGNPKR